LARRKAIDWVDRSAADAGHRRARSCPRDSSLPLCFLSKPEHFHPAAHTLVDKAHEIIAGVCEKCDGGEMKSAGLSIIKGNSIDWDMIEGLLMLEVDENPERAAMLAERLQRAADVELVCEYLGVEG